jgi:hypothetical protein
VPEALAHYDDDYIDEPRPRARQRNRKASQPVESRGAMFSLIRRHPGRALGAGLCFAVIGGIVANATLMQSARHPAPLFAGSAPILAPQPAAAPAPAAPAAVQQSQASPSVAPSQASRPNDITALLQSTMPRATAPARASLAPREKVDAAPAHKEAATAHKDVIAALLKTAPAAADKPGRITAVQRALQKVGYVVRPDGIMNLTTRQAIERYEKDRGLTVTGELSPRTIKELASQSGVAIP